MKVPVFNKVTDSVLEKFKKRLKVKRIKEKINIFDQTHISES